MFGSKLSGRSDWLLAIAEGLGMACRGDWLLAEGLKMTMGTEDDALLRNDSCLFSDLLLSCCYCFLQSA